MKKQINNNDKVNYSPANCVNKFKVVHLQTKDVGHVEEV